MPYRNVVVVCAAGNDYESVSYPASISEVIAVGAVYDDKTPAIFSNYGTDLDVVAPGVNIYSTNLDGTYESQDGTSFAAPQVSAIAALILSVNPNLSQKQVVDIIESTAQKVGGYIYAPTSGRPNGDWNEHMGYGLVNANRALRSLFSSFDAGIIAPEEQRILQNTAPELLTSSVDASGGTGSYTYQWQSSLDRVSWTIIDNATSTTYQSPELTETTYFRRQVTDGNETIESNTAVVMVFPPLDGGIIAPESQTIFAGEVPAEIISVADPSGGLLFENYDDESPYWYHWQRSLDGEYWPRNVFYPGFSKSLQLPAMHETMYFRRITSSNGSEDAVSNTVVVNVVPPLTGGTIAPETQTIAFGATPSQLTSTEDASGGIGDIVYQWQSSIDGTNWSPISNASSVSYRPSALMETTYYRRQATSDTELAYSNQIIVIVGPATPTLVKDGTMNDDRILTISVSNYDSNTTYEWRTSFLVTRIVVEKENGYIKLRCPKPWSWFEITMHIDIYCRAIKNGIASEEVILHIQDTLIDDAFYAGIIEPDSQTTLSGTSPELLTNSASALGAPQNITYQWLSSADRTNWVLITNAQYATYQPQTLTETTYYRRQATDNTGTVAYSNTVVVNVTDHPIIGGRIAPETQIIASGSVPSQLTSSAPALSIVEWLTYQWEQSSDGGASWTRLFNTTLANYQPSAIHQTGIYYYRRRATAATEIAYSNTIAILVY